MYITVNNAKQILLKKYPDSVVNAVLDTPSGYILYIQPKDWDKSKGICNGYFKINKTTGKISEYSPVMDPEEFKTAMKNRIE